MISEKYLYHLNETLEVDSRKSQPSTSTIRTLGLVKKLVPKQRKGDATKDDQFYNLGNSLACPKATT